MKKILITLALIMVCFANSYAYDACIDGIYYNLDSEAKQATVTYKANSFNSYSDNIVIPEKITFNDVEYSVTSIGDDAFAVCDKLTSVTIPNSVTSIGDDAFAVCDRLTSVTIPNSVTSIGKEAFYNCTGLTSVTIGNSVTSIEKSVFLGCSLLKSVNIPNSVTSIGVEAFYKCTGLTSITIPTSVTSIGGNAFHKCTGLTSIVVESGNTVYDSRDNCNAIIQTSTNELIVGSNNSVIPNSVTSIGNDAFYSCSGLTSIEIPNSVTNIGVWAFSGCSGLTSIQIPNSVTSIGNDAFSYCAGLTSLTIGNSVSSIGQFAFYGCTGLTSITCEAVTPPTCNSYSFTNVSTDIPVYVPKASLDAYKSADVWKNFTNIQAIPYEEPTPVPDTDISCYDNVIYTSNVKTYPGGKATLSIKLKNAAAMTGYQFDLSVPCADLSTATATRTKTRKDDNVSLSSQIQSDGSYRVICYTTDDTYFSGNDGEVCTITFTVPEGTAEGDYPVYITTTRLSDGNNTISINDSIKSTLTVEDYTLGDANCDGEVNVGDLSTIVKFILGTSITSNFNESAADANSDGEINVGDLSKIVKMILGTDASNVKSRIAPKLTADNQATMNAKSLEMKPGEDALMYVNLDNSMDVASFQFDMTLPEGFTCENVTADYRRVEENASMNYAKMNENSTRVLCYSPSNETINGTSGNIAIIKIHADNDLQAGNYEATISGIKVANADECKGVEDFTFDISVGSATGIQGIMSDNNSNTTKYDMSGRAVSKTAQGIIISNGKKYLKK